MEIRFDGRRALVTGAGKGIGRGVAIALLKGGAETFALSRTQADLDSLKQEYPTIHTVCVDVSDWKETRTAVENIGDIDLLVNNAGVYIEESFLDVQVETIDTILDIHIKAVFNISQVAAKGMIERGKGGAIVNISSISAQIAEQGKSVYSMSKAALDQLTRCMALELGPHQIRVNSVGPSLTSTNMTKAVFETMPESIADWKAKTPLHRLAEVKDVVHSVLYLLSDKSDMITGTTLVVDGGLLVG